MGMYSIKAAAMAAVLGTAFVAPAHAETMDRWFVHAGPAFVQPVEKTTMEAGGAPVPGADVKIKGRWTVEGEVGYFLTPHVAVGFAAGLPPTFKVQAAGTLTGLGTAGKITGGPAALTLQYHFNRDGRIQPYVGAGASFLIVFKTKDAVLTDVSAKSNIGTALQAGADFMFTDRLGGYIDVKKAFVSTVATGFLGPAPVRAKVLLDPIAANAGVTYHF
jgi:outer membrane protein